MPLTLKNFNQQPRPYTTFTISWTEGSDMSSGWTYSDDAAGLTAGDSAFDEFFGYSGVRLDGYKRETAEITQLDSGGYGKLDITQLGTLTSGDNVMIKFPVRGIKMTKSGSAVTLSITEGLGREREGYQYYAFQNTGDIEANASTTVETKPLYIGAYLGYFQAYTYLRSWSGQTPSTNITPGDCLSAAQNNGTGYHVMGWYQRQLINAYYMMKYGNPDSQSVVGMGYVKGNSGVHSTGGTNSQINATYGSTSGSIQCKLFGIEDWWGNLYQFVGGMFIDASKNMYTALHNFTENASTSETQYKNAGAVANTSGYCLSSIGGNNKIMFGPTGTVSNSSYNTYYCDWASVSASSLPTVSESRNNGFDSGVFTLNTGFTKTSSVNYMGSRIMCL